MDKEITPEIIQAKLNKLNLIEEQRRLKSRNYYNTHKEACKTRCSAYQTKKAIEKAIENGKEYKPRKKPDLTQCCVFSSNIPIVSTVPE